MPRKSITKRRPTYQPATKISNRVIHIFSIDPVYSEWTSNDYFGPHTERHRENSEYRLQINQWIIDDKPKRPVLEYRLYNWSGSQGWRMGGKKKIEWETIRTILPKWFEVRGRYAPILRGER